MTGLSFGRCPEEWRELFEFISLPSSGGISFFCSHGPNNQEIREWVIQQINSFPFPDRHTLLDIRILMDVNIFLSLPSPHLFDNFSICC